MINISKKEDPRFWDKWKRSGAIGTMPGIAYAFFDCDASIQELEESMPEIRGQARAPESLQILLSEGISKLPLGKTLIRNLQYPNDYRVMSSDRMKQGYGEERRPLAGMKYSLVANYSGADNQNTANELGDVMNVIHKRFNKDQELFRGAVVYEKNGQYCLRE